jgi:hypothetical protein
MESITNRLDQENKRISKTENKIEKMSLMDSNKKRNNHGHIQHFCDANKVLNQWIYHVNEGTEIQTKSTEKLFNEIIAESFPYLGNEMDIQIHEVFGTPNTCGQKKNLSMSHCAKLPRTQSKGWLLKDSRENCQVT